MSGFGTVGATWHTGDELGFRRSVVQGHAARSGAVDLATDSVLGLQLSAGDRHAWGANVQGVARLRSDGRWRPRLSRAFVRFESGGACVVRAGRLGLDMLLLAESGDVGFSYLPVRPSPELFGGIGADHFDGADLAVTAAVGKGLVATKAFAGSLGADYALAAGTTFHARVRVAGVHSDWLYGPWVVRLGVAAYDVDEPYGAALAAVLRSSGLPEPMRVADRLLGDGSATLLVHAGIGYDAGPLQVNVRTGRFRSERPGGRNQQVEQLVVGYRFGSTTPYASLALARNTRAPLVLDAAGAPALQVPAGLLADYQAVERTHQSAIGVGVRVDVGTSADVKLQLDRVRFRDATLPFDWRAPPRGAGSMSVLTGTLDFRF